MRHLLVALLGLASCGGVAIVTPGDSSSSTDSNESVASPDSAPVDAGPCVLANDGNWHCGSTIHVQCIGGSAGPKPDGNCEYITADYPGGSRCLACDGVTGHEFVCMPVSSHQGDTVGHEIETAEVFACSQ
jgi:hypothetical protein